MKAASQLLTLWDRLLLSTATHLSRRRRRLSRIEQKASVASTADGDDAAPVAPTVNQYASERGYGLQLLLFLSLEWIVRRVAVIEIGVQ